MKRRRIRNLVLFLLLGAIVNVAVAWGCAMWAIMTPGASARASVDDMLEWARLNASEGAPFESAFVQHEPYGSVAVETLRNTGFGHQARTISVIHYRASARQRWSAEHVMSVAAGWPCQSFIGERWEVSAGWDWYVASPQIGANIPALPKHERERHVVSIVRPDALGGPSFRIVPLRPAWFGFAINTLLYAAILWLLFAAPGKLRRWRRRKRGLCAACAYPIGSSENCTECGAPIVLTMGPVGGAEISA